MRYRALHLIWVLALFLTACGPEIEGYRLDGRLDGEVPDSTEVLLRGFDEKGLLQVLDTAWTQDGTFRFEGVADIPEYHYILVRSGKGNGAVVLENGPIRFRAHVDSLSYATVSGTKQNEYLMDYETEKRRIEGILKEMNAEYRSAQAAGDVAVMESLQDELEDLRDKNTLFVFEFLEEHPDALTTARVLNTMRLRRAIRFEDLVTRYNTFTDEIKATRPGRDIGMYIEREERLKIGAKAPDFKGPTLEGGEFTLSDNLGTLTLIDFWASWCAPCRLENPNLLAIHEKYAERGLNIVGVSIDLKKEDWSRAVEEDGLPWIQVGELRSDGAIADTYGAETIPTSFLLNREGTIVARDLRGTALEQKIAELLGPQP